MRLVRFIMVAFGALFIFTPFISFAFRRPDDFGLVMSDADLFGSFLKSVLATPAYWFFSILGFCLIVFSGSIATFVDSFDKKKGSIRVRLQDGRTGTIDEKDFDPQTMEKL